MKRFTETTKWDDPWFRRLKPKFKCLWLFLCDRCDAAGVWVVDMELVQTFIGEKLKADDALESFDGRVVSIRDDKWWIPKFIEFQYGKLSRDCKPHAQVFSALERHGISLDDVFERVSKGYPKGIQTLQEKDKDKDKEKDLKGESEGIIGTLVKVPSSAEMAEEIYQCYPKKVAKPDALKAIIRALKKFPSDFLREKTVAFAKTVAGSDMTYVPYPATWFNRERFNDTPETWASNNRYPHPKSHRDEKDAREFKETVVGKFF